MHPFPRQKRQACIALTGALCLSLCLYFFALLSLAAPVSLPNFNVDLAQTSVSGLSAGGFMAVQFGVAHSSLVKGVGVIAGGPYYCAQGDAQIAATRCSCTGIFSFLSCRVAPGSTEPERLAAVTAQYARDGAIDPVAGMAGQRIWMFSGMADSVVPPPVMHDLLTYYRHYIDAEHIRFRNDMRAEHAFPADGFGGDCARLRSPYINDCRFDAAGELLQWIYGGLQPKSMAPPGGRFIEFDQSEFVDDHRPTDHGMAYSGYAYVPANCDKSLNRRCRLHVAFHGCKQDYDSIGGTFIRHAGYNAWADANDLIVLYPQAAAKLPRNPNACWNWFDFDRDDSGYATRNGRQMRAVKGMIDRIAGRSAVPVPQPLPRCFTASNAEHVRAGRAHDWFHLARANGSDRFIGLDNRYSITTLKQRGSNYYELGTCP